MLSAIDRDRIAKAVSEAEAATSGEILVVLAAEVSRYREIPLAWAAALSLSLPPIVLSLSLRPLTDLLVDPWSARLTLAQGLGAAVALYAAAQIVLFLAVLAVAHIPAVRRRLTPRVLKRHRVARAAHHQFLSMGARASHSETGVLVFVALGDRQVQVLADAGIHQKCGEAPWSAAAEAIASAMKGGQDPTSGVVQAVGVIGAALAEHYPAKGPHAGDFRDAPLEI